jgi:hypothetical protein
MQPPGWPLTLTVRGTLFTWTSNSFYTYGIYTGDSSTSVLIADFGQDAIDNGMVPDGSDVTKWYLNISYINQNVDAFVADTSTSLFTLLGAWSPDPNVFVPNATVYGFHFFNLSQGLFNNSTPPDPNLTASKGFAAKYGFTAKNGFHTRYGFQKRYGF